MTKELHNLFPFLTGALTLALAASTAWAQAQPQQIPNMGQQITPLAPVGTQFQGLNPGLGAPAQDWLVSNAVSTVVSPDPQDDADPEENHVCGTETGLWEVDLLKFAGNAKSLKLAYSLVISRNLLDAFRRG